MSTRCCRCIDRCYRPNFVVEAPPHAEDTWDIVSIGEVKYKVEKPCTRCSQVMTHPIKGEADKVNWLSKVLAKHRFSGPNDAYQGRDASGTKFGIYLTPLEDGHVQEGDKLTIIKAHPSVPTL